MITRDLAVTTGAMMGAREPDQLGWHYCYAQASWVWLQALQEAGGEEKALAYEFPGNSFLLKRVLNREAKCLLCQWAYVHDWFRSHSLLQRVEMISWSMRARVEKIKASLIVQEPEHEEIPESGPREIRKSMNPEGSEMDQVEKKKDPVLW